MIDHTQDIAQQKAELAQETNKKEALYQLLIEESDKYNKLLQESLAQRGLVARVKAQIKCSEDKIKTLKHLIRTEGALGG